MKAHQKGFTEKFDRHLKINPQWVADMNRKDDLLREALEAMNNLAPRVKEYGGCFGKMAGTGGGHDCTCTACKIRRELK